MCCLRGFVVEGYPRTAEQARDFEANVEKVDLVLLIDCTESFCAAQLRERDEELEESTIAARLALFKHHTLPMLKYFDEGGKLRVVRAKPDKTSVSATTAFQASFPDTKHLVSSLSLSSMLHHTLHQTQSRPIPASAHFYTSFLSGLCLFGYSIRALQRGITAKQHRLALAQDILCVLRIVMKLLGKSQRVGLVYSVTKLTM